MTPQIENLNRRLIADLGYPPYAWVYSESPELTIKIARTDSEGKPVAGLIHTPAGPLYSPVDYEQVKAVEVTDQWILCHRVESMSEDVWRMTFGLMLDWPRGGRWVPCLSGTGEPVSPGSHRKPTLEDTQAVIRAIRHSRSMTPADYAAQAEARRKAKEKESYGNLQMKIADAAPAFGGRPGSNTHWGVVPGNIQPASGARVCSLCSTPWERGDLQCPFCGHLYVDESQQPILREDNQQHDNDADPSSNDGSDREGHAVLHDTSDRHGDHCVDLPDGSGEGRLPHPVAVVGPR